MGESVGKTFETTTTNHSVIDVKLIIPQSDQSDKRVAVVAAQWNSFVTDKLLEGAKDVLKSKGLKTDNIIVVRCPGAYEIPLTVEHLLHKVDGVIALGAVIRGETPHFDYVCDAVTSGVTRLNLDHRKPVSFGILTTDTVEQALERADVNTAKGNKGAEAALACLEMLSIIGQIDKI